MDALSSGFIIPLWGDLYVSASNGMLNLKFPENFPMSQSLGQHPARQLEGHPLADKPYGTSYLKFINPWVVETEPGYSCLFTSPLNHLETRFKVLDGVVDTDSYYNNINFPFVWTAGDGEFFIPKGTPLVQVIPFKREAFKLMIEETDTAKSRNTLAKLGTCMRNGYRSLFWHKKSEVSED